MKRILIALTLMATYQFTAAQSVKQIFEEFGKEYQAEKVYVSPFLMNIGRLFMDNDTPDIVKCIKSVRVLDLEDCSDQTKQRFCQKMDKLNTEGYETMIQTIENGEKVQILARMKKETVKELLILNTGGGECSLIQLKGKIKPKDIAKLVNEQTSKQKNGRKSI